MKDGQRRDSQLASLIAEELDLAFGSASDSRLADLVITGIEPKPGGGHFIVFLAVEEGSVGFRSLAEMKEVLKRATGFLRAELSQALNLKRAPELTFVPDPLCLLPSRVIPS